MIIQIMIHGSAGWMANAKSPAAFLFAPENRISPAPAKPHHPSLAFSHLF
jgi:hypothetical protein